MRPFRGILAYGRWLDPALALALFGAAEAELLAAAPWRRSLALDSLLLAALTLPVAWRRRAPLGTTCVVMTAAVVLAVTPVYDMNLATPNYAAFVLPYTVAAYEARRRALCGLAVCLSAMVLGNVISSSQSSSYVFALSACTASWAAGRVLRARNELAAQLRRTAELIESERADRERLAVAEERTRIARELQAVIVRSLSAMVVQSEAAQRLLDSDPERADEAMAAIDGTGRQALAEMRRLLGTLRSEFAEGELAPQPGVGQLHALIEGARAQGCSVALRVTGEPRPLLPSADLGLYRILEEALAGLGDSGAPVEVVLSFGDDDVGLEVTTRWPVPLSWPTPAMRERIALCEGELQVERVVDAAERLRVRLPASLEGALA